MGSLNSWPLLSHLLLSPVYCCCTVYSCSLKTAITSESAIVKLDKVLLLTEQLITAESSIVKLGKVLLLTEQLITSESAVVKLVKVLLLTEQLITAEPAAGRDLYYSRT